MNLIHGLHHLTACVNGAQEDIDFHTKILGLRLVKQTVLLDGEIPVSIQLSKKFVTKQQTVGLFSYQASKELRSFPFQIPFYASRSVAALRWRISC